MGATSIGSVEWADAALLVEACTAAGYVYFAEGFTGG
jgi:hypothetical protein